MTERTEVHLTEQDVRVRLKVTLEKLQKIKNSRADSKGITDSNSVDYHIDTIIKAGGGIWNETMARDYLQNLEAQIGQEIETSVQ